MVAYVSQWLYKRNNIPHNLDLAVVVFALKILSINYIEYLIRQRHWPELLKDYVLQVQYLLRKEMLWHMPEVRRHNIA